MSKKEVDMANVENMANIPQSLTKMFFNTFIRKYLQRIEENLNMLGTMPFVFIIVNTVVDDSAMMDDFASEFRDSDDSDHDVGLRAEEYRTVLTNILDDIQETKPVIQRIPDEETVGQVEEQPDHIKDLWVTCHKIKHTLDTFLHKASRNQVRDLGEVFQTIGKVNHLVTSYSDKQQKLIKIHNSRVTSP